LKSICIPSSVQIIDGLAFCGCSSLSLLTFESPSLLRVFSWELPQRGTRIDIPDSVRFIACQIQLKHSRHAVLNFGAESELDRFHLSNNHYRKCGAFIRYSELTLRRFRSRPELNDLYSEEQIKQLKEETEDMISRYESEINRADETQNSSWRWVTRDWNLASHKDEFGSVKVIIQ
jgi:hypothetical protein